MPSSGAPSEPEGHFSNDDAATTLLYLILNRSEKASKMPAYEWSMAKAQFAVLFETVTAQLKSKAVTVKTRTLVDATILASASEDDADARWVKLKGKPAVHGYKAHVGADADTALVEQVSVTSANVNDGKAGPEALPDNPGEMFADNAYRGNHFGDAVQAKGGIPRIVATGVWARNETEAQAWLHQWNQPIHRVRGRIEKIFGTWKRCYGLRRMRWRGLAKAAAQVHLTAIAYNLKRTMNILAAAA